MRSPGLVGILRLASLNAWLPQSREPRQANAPAMTILDTYTTSDSRPGQTDAPRSASRTPQRGLRHTNDCRYPSPKTCIFSGFVLACPVRYTLRSAMQRCHGRRHVGSGEFGDVGYGHGFRRGGSRRRVLADAPRHGGVDAPGGRSDSPGGENRAGSRDGGTRASLRPAAPRRVTPEFRSSRSERKPSPSIAPQTVNG